MPVKILDVSLGRANPPDAILHQRVETAAQEQRINTEKQKKLAEDQRKLAEESRAAADQAYNQKMGLNTEQYVALQAIQMQRDVCAQGHLHVHLRRQRDADAESQAVEGLEGLGPAGLRS